MRQIYRKITLIKDHYDHFELLLNKRKLKKKRSSCVQVFCECKKNHLNFCDLKLRKFGIHFWSPILLFHYSHASSLYQPSKRYVWFMNWELSSRYSFTEPYFVKVHVLSSVCKSHSQPFFSCLTLMFHPFVVNHRNFAFLYLFHKPRVCHQNFQNNNNND